MGETIYLSFVVLIEGSRVGSYLVLPLFVDGFPFYIHIFEWVLLWTNGVVFMIDVVDLMWWCFHSLGMDLH